MTMLRRTRLGLLAIALALSVVRPGAQGTPKPLRVVLIVDSSSAMAPMLNDFRAGLAAFVSAMPEDAEVALVSTGGQLRIRVPPDADRERLNKGVAIFAQDGGANAFLPTLLEADKRLMKPATGKRQVYVLLMTDSTTRGELPIDDYNKFMNDFRGRGGRAHAIVIRSNSTMGTASEVLGNLAQNTGGMFRAVALSNSLKEFMTELGTRVAGQ